MVWELGYVVVWGGHCYFLRDLSLFPLSLIQFYSLLSMVDHYSLYSFFWSRLSTILREWASSTGPEEAKFDCLVRVLNTFFFNWLLILGGDTFCEVLILYPVIFCSIVCICNELYPVNSTVWSNIFYRFVKLVPFGQIISTVWSNQYRLVKIVPFDEYSYIDCGCRNKSSLS